jgi:hypothetical protein
MEKPNIILLIIGKFDRNTLSFNNYQNSLKRSRHRAVLGDGPARKLLLAES